jgi:hypothetical protein
MYIYIYIYIHMCIYIYIYIQLCIYIRSHFGSSLLLGWPRSAVRAAMASVREKVSAWESRTSGGDYFAEEHLAPVLGSESVAGFVGQEGIELDEDKFLIKALEAVAAAGASRQVVAATLAAVVRLRRERLGDRLPKDVEALVGSRLEALRPVLRAQTVAGLVSGQPQHRPPEAVWPAMRLRANAARHLGFELSVPLSSLSDADLRRAQRNCRTQAVLDDADAAGGGLEMKVQSSEERLEAKPLEADVDDKKMEEQVWLGEQAVPEEATAEAPLEEAAAEAAAEEASAEEAAAEVPTEAASEEAAAEALKEESAAEEAVAGTPAEAFSEEATAEAPSEKAAAWAAAEEAAAENAATEVPTEAASEKSAFEAQAGGGSRLYRGESTVGGIGKEAWDDEDEDEENGDQGLWGLPAAECDVPGDFDDDDSGLRNGPEAAEDEEDDQKMHEQVWLGEQAVSEEATAGAPSEEAATEAAAEEAAAEEAAAEVEATAEAPSEADDDKKMEEQVWLGEQAVADEATAEAPVEEAAAEEAVAEEAAAEEAAVEVSTEAASEEAAAEAPKEEAAAEAALAVAPAEAFSEEATAEEPSDEAAAWAAAEEDAAEGAAAKVPTEAASEESAIGALAGGGSRLGRGDSAAGGIGKEAWADAEGDVPDDVDDDDSGFRHGPEAAEADEDEKQMDEQVWLGAAAEEAAAEDAAAKIPTEGASEEAAVEALVPPAWVEWADKYIKGEIGLEEWQTNYARLRRRSSPGD